MDTTQAIILIFIVNTIITGLVGGIVIYTIQKKIDATIQKSLFEHQTKFARIHQKRVETLETVYRKFLNFAEGFTGSVLKALNYGIASNEVTKINMDDFEDFDDHREEIEDCWTYFMNNRLFLSANASKELRNILRGAQSMPIIIDYMLFNKFEKSPHLAHLVNSMVKVSQGGLSELDLHEPNFALMLHEMVQKVNSDTLTLEILYRSVADIET